MVWWTRIRPTGELQWRMDQAVLDIWNDGTHIETLTVPKGESLIGFEGPARGQAWYLGGGNQLYVPGAPLRVVNFGGVAMSKEAALNSLSRLGEILTSSKNLAELKGLNDYYTRDVQFLEQAKSYLRLGDRANIQWVFDQMRNLSQGFGSYSPKQDEIDETLDRLFVELQDTLTYFPT